MRLYESSHRYSERELYATLNSFSRDSHVISVISAESVSNPLKSTKTSL